MRVGEIGLETTEAGTAVVSISGEHDLNTAPDLKSRLDELTGSGSAVVLDLSSATFVDSSILGVILEARRRALESGLGFGVAQVDGAEAVSRVLEVTGLREELPVHASREGALSDAEGGAPEKASS